MKWITRECARVDRIACPWLISRFIDPEPEFLFVPANQCWRRRGVTTPSPTTSPTWSWVITVRSVPSTPSSSATS